MKGETSMAGLRREETGSHDLDDDHDDHDDLDDDDENHDDKDNGDDPMMIITIMMMKPRRSTGCSLSLEGSMTKKCILSKKNVPPKNINFFLSSKQCNESFP